MTSRRGFSFIELLTTMILIGILAGLAIMKYIDLKNAAQSSAVIGDFHAIRVATYTYYADKQKWPPETPAGTVGDQLRPYLPTGFSYVKPDYVLDFDNVGPAGDPFIIGVTVRATQPRLASKLLITLGAKLPFIVSGSAITYIIVGAGGFD